MHDRRRPTRVLAYVRVSSDTQERSGTSLAGQRDEITAYCAAVGWPAPRFYVEAESASGENLENRVELRALLQLAARGDAVVVTKQDRWTRDTAFFLQSVKDLQSRGVEFVSTTERFDRTTPEGLLAATQFAAFAEFERANIRNRTEGRRRALRNQGCWTEGVSPFGYKRDPSTRRLVIQPSEAGIVRDVHTRCIHGESLPSIAEWLCDMRVGRVEGPPIKWDRKAVHKLLRARWYLGEIRRTDGTWTPAHEAIVTPDVYALTQRALEDRRKGGRLPSTESRTSSWLLRRLAYCGSCGSRMGSAYSRHDAPSGYYACAGRVRRSGPATDCDEPYARVDVADAEASRQVVRRLEELRDLLASASPVGGSEPDVDRAESLRGSLASAKLRRERAVSLAVDGVIGKDELRPRLEKIDAEIVRLEGRLADERRKPNLGDPKVRASALADIERIRLAWSRLNVEGKRAIVERLAERIEFRTCRVHMQWRSAESLCAATGAGSLKPTPVDTSPRRGRK